jgi:stress-induced morphogen
MTSRPIYQSIHDKLTESLTPLRLTINDESHMHRGHAGVKGATVSETHFAIDVVSAKFSGMNRVQRQRLINDLLREEFTRGLHALSLSCKAPNEV